ncbi:MAG: CHASE domain-containing protein [Pseudomonadaceae bacterium]
MTEDESPNVTRQQLAAAFSRQNGIAWFVLVLGLLTTLMAWVYLMDRETRAAEREFKLLTDDITEAIRKRMIDHEQILLGGAGLFDASGDVDRQEWRILVERLRLAESYPGILGVGYAQSVAPEELAAFEDNVRAEGYPDFRVHPEGDRPLYTSIVYLEPFSGRNLAAFGYDMYSEPTRHAAMQAAAESGLTRVTGPVKLLQETHGVVQAGILMYVPVYRQGLPLDTPAQRMAALRGFVYSPYRMGDLLAGILGQLTPGIGYRLLDTAAGLDNPVLFADLGEAGSSPALTRQLALSLYGRDWMLEFNITPSFDQRYNSSGWIFVVGLCISILLFLMATLLVLRREQAEVLAQRMTRELRNSNAALRQSEERQRLVLEGSNDGWWDVNVPEMRFMASARAWEMLGYPPLTDYQSLHRWQSMISPDARHALIRLLHDAVYSTQAAFGTETRLSHKAGHQVPVLLRGLIQRDNQGNAVRISGTMLDLTEQKRVEQMKSQFVSTVSHELRTPLTSISGALAIVNSGSLGIVPETMRKMLEIAENNSQRLNHLINDLLDMEKLAAGKMKFEMRSYRLRELIDEALTANRAFADSRNIRLLCSDVADVWVRVDNMRLHQVLNNYLSNAIKFSPEGAEVRVGVSLEQDQVRVSVTDQGEGIPKDFQAQVFGKFAQADASDKRKQPGTGLGLAISRELMEQMSGEVGFVSEPPEGATFWFRLPIDHVQESALDPSEQAKVCKVLIIDDDPMIADFIALVLRKAGYLPSTSITLHGAQALLEQEQFDALVTDLRLQDGHGLNLIREVRAQPHLQRMPILVVSAYCDEGQRLLQGQTDERLAWLDKPVDEKKLLIVLEELVQRTQAR